MNETELSSAIASLPPEINPYEWILEADLNKYARPGQRRQSDMKIGTWFENVLDVAFALQGIGLFLSLALLAVKILSGSFWLFRKRALIDGVLVTSNSVVFFALLHIVHYAFFLPCTYHLRQAFFHKEFPVHYQALISSAFTPIALLGWLEAHGSASSVILAWPTLASGVASPCQMLENIIVHYSKAVARGMNAFVFIGVTATVVLNYAFFAVATVHFKQTGVTFGQTKASFAEAMGTWTPEKNFTMPDGSFLLLQRFEKQATSSAHWIGRGFGVYTISFLLVLILYIPSVSIYLSLLGRQLRLNRAQAKQAAFIPGFVPGEKEHALRVSRTYTLILIESFLVLLLTFMFTAICIWITAMPKEVLSHATYIGSMWTAIGVLYQAISVPLLAILVTRAVLSSDFRWWFSNSKSKKLNMAFVAKATVRQAPRDEMLDSLQLGAVSSEREMYRKM